MNRQTPLATPTLTVWRDSVCAGDDTDAPHELKLSIGHDESLGSVISRVVAANYLASIAGGDATWILESGSRPLAVVAQQWTQPRFLVGADRSIASLVTDDSECHLNFRYWCQADPDQVFECLQQGQPLPGRYG